MSFINHLQPAFSLSRAGWFLTICFIGMTFVPRSFDQVLFVDGLAYAAISRNMAMGYGSFWEPYFADSFWLSFNELCPFFCDQPPLMFGIQSLLFRLMGDTIAVENIYNLITLIASALLISVIWKVLFRHNTEIRNQSWLPVLMWYSIKVVWWSVPNNLLDTTMAVFCMWSVYYQLKAFTTDKRNFVYWILAGLMIGLACLTKGPVGLFPLAFPVLYAIVYGKISLSKATRGVLIVGGSFTVFIAFILMYPPANYFLTNYFKGQVLLALLKKREKVSNHWTAHFYLLNLLFKNVIPHVILLVSLVAVSIRAKIKISISQRTHKVILLIFLVVVSVVLPMLISVKQGDYYLMPALPFIGIFFGACIVELLMPLASRSLFIPRVLFPACALIFGILMIYKMMVPDGDFMFEVSHKITRYVPARSKIYLPPKISKYSEIHTPFQRYARLSISYDPRETDYLYFESSSDAILDSMQKIGSVHTISLGGGAVLAIKNKK
jgi:4-amino-4-deoxy-L-arabinose transferase-like glycosyltransferase